MDTPSDDERIRQHADLVYRTCLRLTGNAQDAADVAQEVFVAWLRSHREIRGSVAAWLYGTARQRSLDWLRTNHRRQRHERQAALTAVAGEPADDWQGQLDEALNGLPDEARTLVIEHHLLGLTQGQLAKRHRCTQATISRRLTQTLELLRTTLQARGVTVGGAVLVAAFTTARATACPAPLVAPVLAQAQVVGATALVGPPVIVGLGLLGWSAVAGGVLLVLTLLGGVGLWWWSTEVARELDRDWTAVATAHLPPVHPAVRAAVQVPPQGPRYPSIEALIARQPPLDAARQARMEAIIAPGGVAPWSWVDEWSMTALSSMASKLKSGDDLKPDEVAMVQKWRAWLRPLLEELRQGEAALGSGVALASAYAAGRLGGMEQRGAWLRSRTGGEHAVGHLVASILIHAATQAPDPRAELRDLDLWVTAYSRASTTFFEALQAYALVEIRDRFYQELAWRGRLPPDAQQRWLAEPCPITALMSDAMVGETLFMLIPRLDDLRAGRAEDLGVLGNLFYLTQGQAMSWIPHNMDIIQQVLAGEGAERFRALAAEGQHDLGGTYWYMVKNLTYLTAISETRHRANRLAVEILTRARLGDVLPAALATDAGQSANTWGLRYERRSATRFALVFDPDAGIPASALPDTITEVRSEVREEQAKSRTKPMVNQRLLIEMEVTPPAVPMRFDLPDPPALPPLDELPPPIPSVAQ